MFVSSLRCGISRESVRKARGVIDVKLFQIPAGSTSQPCFRAGDKKLKKTGQRQRRCYDLETVRSIRHSSVTMLTGTQIKVCMIENRLLLLDEAGDNDYFKMPYGAYKYERWGRGV